MTAPSRRQMPQFNMSKAMENISGVESRKIDMSLIRVLPGHNPRGYVTGHDAALAFAGPKYEALVESIRLAGDVLQPVLLRPSGDGVHYDLVAGGRRYYASGDAGLTQISVNIRQMTDDEMVIAMLDENELREDVSKIDMIIYLLDAVIKRSGADRSDLRRIFIRLRDTPQEQWDEVCQRTADAAAFFRLPSYSTLVRSWSRYLDLRPEELKAIKEGLAEDVLLELLQVQDDVQRQSLLDRAREERWTLTQMREAVLNLTTGHNPFGFAKQVSKRVGRLLTPRSLKKMAPERLVSFEKELEALLTKYES